MKGVKIGAHLTEPIPICIIMGVVDTLAYQHLAPSYLIPAHRACPHDLCHFNAVARPDLPLRLVNHLQGIEVLTA